MKKILLGMLLVMNLAAIGQDKMIKIASQINAIKCENITIKNSEVYYTNIADQQQYVCSLDEVSEIQFNEKEPDVVHICKFTLDTVYCKIVSLSIGKINYKLLDSNIIQNIKQEEVFCILFQDAPPIPDIELYKSYFLKLRKFKNNNQFRTLNKRGLIGRGYEPITIEGQIVTFKLKGNKQSALKTDSTNNIAGFMNFNPANIVSQRTYNTYVYTNANSFINMESPRFSDSTIFSVANGILRYMEIRKPDSPVLGIFFQNYASPEIARKAQETKAALQAEREKYSIKIDLNSCIGVLLEKIQMQILILELGLFSMLLLYIS